MHQIFVWDCWPGTERLGSVADTSGVGAGAGALQDGSKNPLSLHAFSGHFCCHWEFLKLSRRPMEAEQLLDRLVRALSGRVAGASRLVRFVQH